MILHGHDPAADSHRYFIARARAVRARVWAAMAGAVWRGAARLAVRTGGRFGTAIGGGWRAMAAAYQRRLALRQLQAMDDALLKDIGLSRSQIAAAVDGRLSFDETATRRRQCVPRDPKRERRKLTDF